MSQLRQSGDYLKDNRSNKCYHRTYTGTNKINSIKTEETLKGDVIQAAECNRQTSQQETRKERSLTEKRKLYNRNKMTREIEKLTAENPYNSLQPNISSWQTTNWESRPEK